jgi:hypothetical protein
MARKARASSARPALRDGVHARQNAIVPAVQPSQKRQGLAFRRQFVAHHRRLHRLHKSILEEHAKRGDRRPRIDRHGIRLAGIQHQERVAVHQPLAPFALPVH